MKKLLIYLFVFLFICFILPSLLTKRYNNETKTLSLKNETNSNINNKEDEKKYKYIKYGKIKLLHKKENKIEELDIDKYIQNVVSAEIPANYHEEALKAQAIVARTYTIYKIKNKKHENADICDDSTCCQAWISKEERLSKWENRKKQVYWNKIEKCVSETTGKVITYNNEVINALFHSNSGGKTELPVNVWGGNNIPYLQVIETSGEEAYTQYSSEVILKTDELLNKLKQIYTDIIINFSNSNDIKIIDHTDSGRVRTVKFGNHNLSGVEVRKIFSLKSTNFEIIKQGNNIKFIVKGYGHGVGMSQTGADIMAKEGKKCEEIIKHFYSNVEIKDINKIIK